MYVHVYNDVTCGQKLQCYSVVYFDHVSTFEENIFVVNTEVHMSPAQYGASDTVM